MPLKRTHRVGDIGGSLWGDVWVECPKCSLAAHVLYGEGSLTCSFCGQSRNYARENMRWRNFRQPFDLVSGQPLWLQAPCLGRVIWAWNPVQLATLESYVEADLRPSYAFQTADGEGAWCNKSYENRLPTWIKLGKNRTAILRTIARIRRDRPLPV